MDLETIAASLRLCVKGEERSRSKRCANLERQKNLNKILERKAEFAVRGENLSPKGYTKLRKTWRGNIGRLIKSSNPNDYSYNRRMSGLMNGVIRLREAR